MSGRGSMNGPVSGMRSASTQLPCTADRRPTTQSGKPSALISVPPSPSEPSEHTKTAGISAPRPDKVSTPREQAAGRASATRLTEGAEKAYFALTERKDDACHHLLEVTRVLNDLPGTNAF